MRISKFLTRGMVLVVFFALLSACGGDEDNPAANEANENAENSDNNDELPEDTTPDEFSFSDADDVEPASEVISDPVTITGIDAETDISITGGEYAIDGGDYVSSDGTVEADQSVTVKTTAPTDYSASLDVVLNVGGVEGTFTVTTRDIPVPEAPQLVLTPQRIKTFSFSWDDVDHETEYRLLETPDGISDHVEIASFDADTTEHDIEVFLPSRINAGYILQACNDSGCTDSEEVVVETSLSEAAGYVKASNTGERDTFGTAVALSDDGNTLAVGADGESSAATGINGDQSNDDASWAGAVYVFARDGDTWNQQAYIKASNTDSDDQFGAAISLSGDGDTLAVGAAREDSNATGIDGDDANNDFSRAGAAYVFSRDGSEWSQQAYIKASNTEVQESFGSALDLSNDGDTLAVSAVLEDSAATGIDRDQSNNDAPASGAVYVYTREDTTWSQQSYVKPSNTEEGDIFGTGLALSGDGFTLAVGAFYEGSSATGIDGDQSSNGASDSGAVYIFTSNGATWSQQAYIKASNTNSGDRFGRDVDLSDDGNTLAVGAEMEESSATGIDGDQSNNDAAQSGAVYVYTREDNTWSHQSYVKASNTDSVDQFGTYVALSGDGNTLVTHSMYEASNATGIDGDQSNNGAGRAGAVYVLTRQDGTWSHQSYVKAPNTESNDLFSSSIALSGDGGTLAVGALQERSSATGINGDQTNNDTIEAGAVYLY